MQRLIAVFAVSMMSLLGVVEATEMARATSLTNGRIAFGEEGPDDILVVASNPDGTHRQELVHNMGCLSWSPDGSKLLVCVPDDRGLARPATINADGTNFTILDNPDPRLNLFCWSWSPDGKRLACEGGEVPPSARDGLYTVRSSDGGDLFRLTDQLNSCCPFIPGDAGPGAYSPDGTQILFNRLNAKGQSAAYVVNTDGTGVRQITPWGLGGAGGRWSGTGWIVFGLYDRYPSPSWIHRGRLYLVRPDGSDLHKIDIDTNGSWYYAKEPTWSPDGTRILFVMYLASNNEGQPDLFTMNPDGSHLRQVTDTPITETTPSWGTHALET
jgi:Tol biopolymer transport system component